jgi:NTP pyrophosphatase (non-canonical NTP hydrolase)
MYLTQTPTAIENITIIRRDISKADLYEQLAEEAAELAQAANKMARVMRGTNPTPKTEEEARNNLIEEYTDVVNVGTNILDIHPDWLIGDYKLYRWTKRIEEKSQKKG